MNSSTTPAPARVRPFGTPLRPSRLQRLIMGRDPSPTRSEYDRLVQALSQGDTLMDAFLEEAGSVGVARAQFERALTGGIESVTQPLPSLVALFTELANPPFDFDPALANEGARFIHSTGKASYYALRDFALMGGYLLSGFNRSLLLTGALAKGTTRRFAETGKWWMDCTTVDGMSRHGAGFETTLRVRFVHAIARKHLQKHPEWDSAQEGLPLNQTDMLATYLAFGPFMLFGLRMLGVPVRARESKAVVHLFNYVGWLMGVQPDLLVDGEQDGLVRVVQTYLTQSRPDESSAILGRALAEEPLGRVYPWSQRWPLAHKARLRFEHARHLSVSSLFLSSKHMQQLGLPPGVKPWFPLLAAPARMTAGALGVHPGLRRRQEEMGRRAQERALAATFGEGEHAVTSGDHLQALARPRAPEQKVSV